MENALKTHFGSILKEMTDKESRKMLSSNIVQLWMADRCIGYPSLAPNTHIQNAEDDI